MVERDLALAALRAAPAPPAAPLGAGVGRGARAARRRRASRASGEVTPHHLCLTDEAVRSLDPNLKMNPPLRSADDRAALIEALRDGTIAAIATDHAPHARHEKEVPFEAAPVRRHRARDRVRRPLHAPRRAGAGAARDAARADVGRAGARSTGSSAPRIAVGAAANLVLLDLGREWTRRRGRLPLPLGELVAARRDAARARCGSTVADGRVAFEA